VTFNYFYRFIFLCKQLVGLCCMLPCPVMIMITGTANSVWTQQDGLCCFWSSHTKQSASTQGPTTLQPTAARPHASSL